MDGIAERSATTAIDAAGVDRAPMPCSDRSERTPRGPRTIARLELRRSGSELVRPGSGAATDDGAAATGPGPALVVDIDLDELLARIGDAIGGRGTVYAFADCELRTGPRSLTRADRPVHLRPKVYRLLVHLLEHRHRAISRDELCDVVWRGRCVGNATIDSTVKALRFALGDDGEAQRVVRTLNGYGYRFVPAVEVSVPGGVAGDAAAAIACRHAGAPHGEASGALAIGADVAGRRDVRLELCAS